MRKVFLHIGAPKTGTTYVQDRLVANTESLKRRGVSLPTKSKLVLPDVFWFRAALDLLGQDWGGPPGHAVGAWDQLVSRVARASNHVIVSHEILAPAQPEHIRRAVTELSRNHELHVIYSARDLARQVPAAWQESIKQGRRWTYRKFVESYLAGDAVMSRSMDLPGVLQAWGNHVSKERIHVVTVPQRGAAKDALWLRMCAALELDPSWMPADSTRTNPSLGAAETAVIRELNRKLGHAKRREVAYEELLLQMLGHRELTKYSAIPVTLPPELYPWAQEQATSWIEFLRASGVHVIGDLDDLRPSEPSGEWMNPDRLPARVRYRIAMVALEAMTHEAAGRPDPKRGLPGLARTARERILRR